MGVYLFFGEQILFYLRNTTDIFERPSARSETEVLKIAYAFPHEQHDPVYFDPVTRGHLVDIYQGLVGTDESLNIRPSLAVSWGLIDPFTWEFLLRRDVKFHNGNDFTSADAAYSIDRARKDVNSQIKSLLNTIESVEVIDDYKLRIHTSVPDPLILQKMAITFIYPDGFKDFESPVGTGPYKFVSHTYDVMELAAFEDYWGTQPAFKNVELRVIEDRRERILALENNEVQMLINMPPNYACSYFDEYKKYEGCMKIENPDVQVEALPGLEVGFLMFNFNNNLFSEKNIRGAVAKALDRNIFIDIAFGFAVPAKQFVSSGVFGFNPDIKPYEYNLESAKEEISKSIDSEFDVVTVTFDYPETLSPVGQYVQTQLGQLGIRVELNPLSDYELQEKIASGESDFYYLGWRSELGDASDFLLSVVHSEDETKGYGLFNGINYANREVDALIEAAQQNMDTKSRLRQLQEAMGIITEQDVIGVPLFESEVVYAFSNKINFKPRIDGYVFASSIK